MNSNTTANPLLDTAGLPHFDTIAPAHVAPAVDALLQAASEALETVTQPDFPADWNTMAATLDGAR
jgi:oligopeptidase A